MATCLTEQEILDFVEGRCSPAQASVLESHLCTCDACQLLVGHAAEATAPARAHREPLAPGTGVDRYIVLGLVGAGAMGAVYAAHDPELDRKIALKLLHEPRGELSSRMLREAQAMARLVHPNVVAVHDVGTCDAGIFLAMDFVAGATLGRWLDDAPRAPAAILDVLARAGQGLAAAHRVGIVHRDFKADNVLLGEDGRVLVTDFGLARAMAAPAAAPAPTPDPETPLALALTATGAVVGTPAFMAPEQLAGGVADARSDVFSFCATLYEALYREHPFPLSSLKALQAAMAANEVRAPARAKVRPWLHRVILRGLRADPAERHPSMDALLSALDAHPRRLRRWARAGVAVAALAAGSLVTFAALREQSRLCSGAAQRLAGIWDLGRKEAVRGAFRATGAPFAESTWTRTEVLLDEHARRWVASHREACEATRVRGEQSERLLDLRMLCLHRRLEETGALVETFASADARSLGKALPAVFSLRAPETCDDARRLGDALEPEDPALRAKVEAVRPSIARVHALRDAGRYRESANTARSALQQAKELGYRPLESEAYFALGSTEEALSDYAAARVSFYGAVLAADASRHEEVAAKARIGLTRLAGAGQGTREEGLRWADLADAQIERLGGDPALRGLALRARGALSSFFGQHRDAEASLEQAIPLLEKGLGAAHPFVARALTSLGIARARATRYPEALAPFQRALAIEEQAFGSDHPSVASSLGNIGTLFRRLGRYEEAVAVQRRALALTERLLGPDAADVAHVLTNLANVLTDLGRAGEAVAVQSRAVAIRERRLGPTDPALANSLAALGRALLHAGRHDEARGYYERALAICERHFGPVHESVGEIVHNLGFLASETKRYDEAEKQLRRGLAIFEKTHGPESGLAAHSHAALGELWRRRGRQAEALAAHQRALAIREKAFRGGHPLVAASLVDLAETWLAQGAAARAKPLLERALRAKASPETEATAKLALGRALWSSGVERSRAHRLVEEALQVAPATLLVLRREARAWLSAHPRP